MVNVEMKRMEKFFWSGLKKLSAMFRLDFSAVCGLYEEGEICSCVLLTENEEPVARTWKREKARESLTALLQEKGLKPETVAGAVILPEITLLDSYEQSLGRLREKELRGAAVWSLRTRESVMERPVWWAVSPVNRAEVPAGTYRIEAIPQEEGEKGAALIRSCGLEPLAVYVMESRKLPEYRIGVPDLSGEKEAKETEPAEEAAQLLWSSLGEEDNQTSLVGAAMNFLPMEQRPERYRWSRVVSLLLIVWLALLTGFFLRWQQEIMTAEAVLKTEETLLHRQSVTEEEYKRLTGREKAVTILEAEAVRLSAERQPVSPTLEALGVFTPAGIRLTEVTGLPEGAVEIKGVTRSRGLVDKFIETYRQEMEPGAMKLKNISGGKSAPLGRSDEREFVIILGREQKQ